MHGLDGALDTEHLAEGVLVAVRHLEVVPGRPVRRVVALGVDLRSGSVASK